MSTLFSGYAGYKVDVKYPKSIGARFATVTLFNGDIKKASVRMEVPEFGPVDEELALNKLAKKLGFTDAAWFCKVYGL